MKMRKYLVVETHRTLKGYNIERFMHFISLSKEEVEADISHFVFHLYYFGEQVVDKVYFSTTRLTNW